MIYIYTYVYIKHIYIYILKMCNIHIFKCFMYMQSRYVVEYM